MTFQSCHQTHVYNGVKIEFQRDGGQYVGTLGDLIKILEC